MRVYQTNEIKNIALLGSAGSGKTTLAEAMLFESGVIKRRGSVEAKNTVSDYFPVEQEYGYSVFSTVFNVEWNNKKLNIIDCPGSDDFVGQAITALNVTDQAVILINGQYGPEVGTQNNFRYTEKLKKPVIFLVNQLDSDKCDFDAIITSMKDIYGQKCVQIQYPIETGAGFNALIDVLLMKKYSWKPEGGAPDILEIPADQLEKAQELHNALVEAAAEHDEGLMEKFFDEGSLTEDEMRQGIRAGLLHRDMFPVFCVCAEKDMCVRRLMEFLGNVVPSVDVTERPQTKDGHEVEPDPAAPTSIYVFKTSVEPHVGEVSYFKVMSGTLHVGDDLQNVNRNVKERIPRVGARQTKKSIVRLVRRKILCRVDRNVQVSRCKHLRKNVCKSAVPDCGKRRDDVRIATRADNNKLTLHAPFQECILHKARLRHSKRGAARSDLQLPHDSSSRARSSRSYASRSPAARNSSARVTISSRFSGKARARRSRRSAAKRGDAPPVEMPMLTSPRTMSAGKKKSQFSLSSTQLTGIWRRRQSAETRAFSAGSSVEAMTKSAPSKTCDEYSS